jgi:hypothetical protein
MIMQGPPKLPYLGCKKFTPKFRSESGLKENLELTRVPGTENLAAAYAHCVRYSIFFTFSVHKYFDLGIDESKG